MTLAHLCRAFFENFGTVLEAFVSYDRHTGRPRGFGFVVFDDPVVADKVVSLQHTIDRREVWKPYHITQQWQMSASFGLCRSTESSVCADIGPIVCLNAARAQLVAIGAPRRASRAEKMLGCKPLSFKLWRQVEAKKAVPKEEQPSGRSLESINPQRTKKIFVGGLAPSVDENTLRGYFEHFGGVRQLCRPIELCPAISRHFQAHRTP